MKNFDNVNEGEISVVCNHCGYDIRIQPPKNTGCNHVYYPEHCITCSIVARELQYVVHYNLSKVTRIRTVKKPEEKNG